MKKLNKSNFFILTGGPGAGKSSVLHELSIRDYCTVPEVARKIIKEQLAINGNAIHTGDQIAFRDLMLKYSIEDYETLKKQKNIIFFDRGIPDILGYSKLIYAPISTALTNALKLYLYNSQVFILPPWEEIYSHDEERKQDFNEAIETYDYIKQAYIHCGYSLIEIPKVDIRSRADFILEHLH